MGYGKEAPIWGYIYMELCKIYVDIQLFDKLKAILFSSNKQAMTTYL